MRLPKTLLIILLVIILVLVVEAVYYFYLTNRQGKLLFKNNLALLTPTIYLPQIIVGSQISSFSASVNPNLTQDEISALLNQYGKRIVKLTIVDNRFKIPRAADGTLPAEFDTKTKQVRFEAMAIYSDDKDVSFYIHPNLAFYLEKGEDYSRLERLFSYQLLKAIIAVENSYLLSGKNPVVVPEEMIDRFVRSKSLIVVKPIKK